ncbi:MAG TPA: hypothetical protein VIT64_12110 [Ilumatobacteraceae bacterium]
MAVDRFSTPLYTVAEASHYLGVPDSTFRSWARGYVRRSDGWADVRGEPIVTVIPGQRVRSASVPFVGLAEGLVLAGIRRAGVPLQRIRPPRPLENELGIAHVLASKSLYTDGAEVLYNFVERSGDPDAHDVRQLVVVRNGQHVYNEVVDRYLRRVEFADDGYAQLIRLPGYQSATVVVDPARGFGQPIFGIGGARVEDALSMVWAGESLADVAIEYGVPEAQLEDALRVATRHAA